MRVLFLGDVVGRPGRRALAAVVPRLRREAAVDFVIANGENASNGKGINPRGAEELRDAGVDVLTSGNHIWQSRDIIPYLRENGRLLRPLNYAPEVPGIGWTVRAGKGLSVPVGVINLIGRTFMGPAGCPFSAVEEVLPTVRQETPVIVVDMHGEATSEKVGMGWFLDGKVSAVVGSHTHVQTADETILPGGTAYLTDAGMCGPERSVLGMRVDQVLHRFRSQMPVRFDVADGPVLVQGALIDVDEQSGHATAVSRVRERVPA
jgi:2',3'-cyclic-nucleotide 2'-phosphodiesterase